MYKKTDARGQEVTLEVVRAGSVFGEMALTAQRLRDTYAVAEEPSVVLLLEARGAGEPYSKKRRGRIPAGELS